jgi:phytoene synthase
VWNLKTLDYFLNFSLHDDVKARLKAADPDRVRAAMFADPEARAKLLLLYAFHLELAKIPELVSEPMIGQIRYQWWREAIAEIYETDSVRKHEITTPLRSLLRDHDIPRFWVDQLIDGRERDIDPRPFESLTAAQDYCISTSGALIKIAVKLCGSEPEEDVEAAGTAWGLTGLARAYCYYHDTMLAEIRFSRLCEAAKSKHAAAQSPLKQLQSEAFPAVAYSALIPGFLLKMSHSKHDPATMSVSYGPLAKQLKLLGAVITGKV